MKYQKNGENNMQSIDRRTGSTNVAMTGIMERSDFFDFKIGEVNHV